MKDRTGRELQRGQIVDLFSNGTFAAYVMEIEEGFVSQLVGATQTRPGRLRLTITTTLKIAPGAEAPVYIVKDAPEKPAEEPTVEPTERLM